MSAEQPPSLAVSPNIPFREQTLEQLNLEREYWLKKIADAKGWGAAVGFANEMAQACYVEIRRREDAK